ncbi:hypothetical protein D3P07_19115 [Paenibacillus sp. 1011MAR3C5]|uniref:hypothetical protein n=1 Tax=Paenibacillus sp. 1011MAR3C5 TaxID=1675787 RepID=UPI000E6C12B2|nr:hypothetical protein [Paenibacillus sp. 1011MAR3C5]RJE86190.1 hypothetical protein D3P07_19115 [Paenibacillus sp. 1011MAR3C5]
MDISFSVCATEVYQTKYLDFMLRHYENLNMPYPFIVTFGFIASPVLLGREAILCLDEENEIVGALGYIHGTGEKQYEDEHVVQIQAVYLGMAYRGTRLFLQGLQFLLHHLKHQPVSVTELVFWTGQEPYINRLAAKFAGLESVTESEFGRLSAYRAPVPDLEAYLQKFRPMTLA